MGGHGPDEELLRRAGIRLTRQRLAVVRLLRAAPSTHLTVDQAYALAVEMNLGLPLATLYNVLNDLSKRGIIRRIGFGERTVYCSNRADHHHFLDPATGVLFDIPGRQPGVVDLPDAPEGTEIDGVDIIVRLRRTMP